MLPDEPSLKRNTPQRYCVIDSTSNSMEQIPLAEEVDKLH